MKEEVMNVLNEDERALYLYENRIEELRAKGAFNINGNKNRNIIEWNITNLEEAARVDGLPKKVLIALNEQTDRLRERLGVRSRKEMIEHILCQTVVKNLGS